MKTDLGIIVRSLGDAAWRDYRHAAVLGDSQAQFYLALHYASGLDGHRDDRLARAWFKRAVRAGEELCAFVSERSDATPEELIRHFEKLLL